mmetsp:Transcript_31500/g.60732  ORF Transcript_31500/g.60732 Transcript_31500/m.60732 type:complete len:82 (-) Transcript_31500:55-300(-)
MPKASITQLKLLSCRAVEQHGFEGKEVTIGGLGVGDKVGEPVGGEVGQSEPRSVPTSAVGQYVPYTDGLTPAGTAPHNPAL